MSPVHRDISQQPQALRTLAEDYDHDEGRALLASIPSPVAPILTGMGASFHAAQVAASHLNSLGIPATAIEATELLHYGTSMVRQDGILVYISQSGASAEVAPITDRLPEATVLLAVTNDSKSPLARHARVRLPVLAGEESLLATKTYINSLAVLWLLARQWGGVLDGSEGDTLAAVAGRIESLLARADSVAGRWLGAFGQVDSLLFVGHGPHAATARQAAMTVSELAKQPTLFASVGAFRHGFIEITQPGLGVVVFAAPGRTHTSAHSLATELSGYGARVLVVENGRTWDVAEVADGPALDEFLSPMVDVIPAQMFAEALTRSAGITPGFRHISKVVTRL